jgi:recombination protein RecT
MKASGVGAAAVAKQAAVQRPHQNIGDFLESKKGAIQQMLPKHVTVDRFLRIVLSAIYNNPALTACTFESILIAVKQAAALGLEPNGPLGHAALVPYRNNAANRTDAQFQVMYKGLITLAYNTGQFQMIDAQIVYVNDAFDYAYGLQPKLEHRPAEGERGEVKGYYAFFILKSGGAKFEYMPKAEVEKWAKRYSKSYEKSDSPWKNFFDAMAMKTVLRKALKLAPMSVELPPDNDDRDIGLRYTSLEPDTVLGTAEPVAEEEPPAVEGEKGSEKEGEKKPEGEQSQPEIF